MNADNRLAYLFHLYYNRQATPEQVAELFDLLKATDDARLTELMQAEWEQLNNTGAIFNEEKSEEMLSKILNARNGSIIAIRRNPWRGWLKVAAIVVFSVSASIYFITRNKQQATGTIAKVAVQHDALPGGNRATLKLANGKTILLDSVPNGLLARQGNMLVKKNRNGQVVYNAEAAATNGELTYNTISTPNGGQYQVVLPDGSYVWLNAASSITFPTAFAGKIRSVRITGEAYFEVAKNPEMPFIVKTDREEIRVLGTHFNVMAYSDENTLKTSLLEGSIQLTGPKSSYILKPGNQALLNEAGDLKLIPDADVEADVAWKNGFFKLNDAGIESIMRQAARWYDVSVSYKGKLPLRHFTGTISRNVKLTEFLSMFKYAGINFDIEGKHITVIN